MSIQVPVSFAQKYRDDFIMLSQQQGSRLRRAVRTDPDRLQGKAGFFDRIGPTAMYELLSRHAPTQLVNTPHSRRRVTLRDFGWADAIDWQDLERMIANPQSRYVTNGMWAAGRTMDDLIYAAARGNAYSIDSADAATAVPLPSAQKVAVASAGLTIAKLISAKKLLDQAEVDPNVKRYFVTSAIGIANLLGTTQVTSSDYNTIKALVAGEINTFLGFEFIRFERGVVSSGTRYDIAFAQTGVGLAVGSEIFVDVGPRRDLNLAVQVYIGMGMDATRIEDVQVVEVACLNT